MSPMEFLLSYFFAGVVMFTAGWIIGSQRAESKADAMRRWWFNRERRHGR